MAEPVIALEDATLNDIVEELEKRYDAFVLAVKRPSQDKGEECDKLSIHFYGGIVCGLGLATAARIYITQSFLSEEGTEEDPDG